MSEPRAVYRVTALKAPFPYPGGKSKVAAEVWRRFGDVPNYVEPFLGSAAVLLARPPFTGNRIETVNDLDGHVANFWRALRADPDGVAYHADWPVSECVPAGTMIATPTGPVPVESIKEGMTVLGERDGAIIPTTVMATRQSWADDFYQVGDLRLTGNHPVWTKDGGYVPAAHLTPGAIVARLNWSVCELDLIMVQSSYDKEDLDYLRFDRPAHTRATLHRGIRAPESKIQRAFVKRGQRGQDASGLLDSVSDLPRDSAGVFSAGRGSRRKLARKGKILDRVLSGTGAFDEYHRRGRGIARLHPDAGITPEVVKDEAWGEVRTWACSGNAREEAYQRNAAEDFRGGASALRAGNAPENIRSGKGARYEQGDQSGGRISPGRAANGRASSENPRQSNGAQAGYLRRDRASIRVDNGRSTALSGQRGVYQSGDPQGLPLQRVSLSPCVAVYNFQTQTGNYFADNILVHNCDLHARGDWLYYRPSAREWVEQLRADPDYYDVKSAGWWVWFTSCWIGALPDMNRRNRAGDPDSGLYSVLPHLGGGKGVARQLPHLGTAGNGVARQLPHLGDAGKGVARQRPHLGSGGQGNGVHGRVSRQMPATNIGGVAAYVNGGNRRANLTAYMRDLAARLERVRVCCGNWDRVTGPSVTWKHGITGVFLDPPYSAEADRDGQMYSTDSLTVAHDVREWAITEGDNPKMRIALCGYDGEGHEELEAHGWTAHYWKANGGYGSQGNGRGRKNAKREVIWFSPHCLNEHVQQPLFRSAP